MQSTIECVHTRVDFHFDLRAPFSRVTLLFGPESENRWAGESWQPKFF
jgi:hypothetical protein